MGLDIIEFVIAVEKSFDLSIFGRLVGDAATVGRTSLFVAVHLVSGVVR